MKKIILLILIKTVENIYLAKTSTAQHNLHSSIQTDVLGFLAAVTAFKCLILSPVNCWLLPRVLKSISIEKLGSSSFFCSMLFNFIEKPFSLFGGTHACVLNHWWEIRDLKQRGRERERRRLKKIIFLVYSLLLCAGH